MMDNTLLFLNKIELFSYFNSRRTIKLLFICLKHSFSMGYTRKHLNFAVMFFPCLIEIVYVFVAPM